MLEHLPYALLVICLFGWIDTWFCLRRTRRILREERARAYAKSIPPPSTTIEEENAASHWPSDEACCPECGYELPHDTVCELDGLVNQIIRRCPGGVLRA